MESIFGAPDIQRQLPDEAKMFNQVDKSWKEIMRRVQKNPLAIRAGTTPGKRERSLLKREKGGGEGRERGVKLYIIHHTCTYKWRMGNEK